MKQIQRFAMLLMVGAALSASAAEPLPVRWSVDPAVEGGAPTISLDDLSTDSLVQVRVVNLRSPAEVLSEQTITASGTKATVTLPTVKNDVAAGATMTVKALSGDETVIKWNTLLRPADQSLFTYTGAPGMEMPADFDAFWQRAKDELAAVPMKAEVSELAWGHTETGLLYEVVLDTVRETKIVCRITIPRAAYDADWKMVKSFPAVIAMPGYGAEQPPMDRTPDGFVTMSVNPRHHGPSKRYWTSPVEHLVYQIEDSEGYYYRLAYLDNLRAAEYLLSRPEVDAARVLAEGGSQGGLFAIALAALEPRIAAVTSNIAAITAIPDGIELNQTGTTQSLKGRLAAGGIEAEAIRRSLAYIDGANMATRVRVPIQINMGGRDPVCHFLTGMVVLHRLRPDVPRQYNLFPDARHEVPGKMREANGAWAKQWLDLETVPRFPGRILKPPTP